MKFYQEKIIVRNNSHKTKIIRLDKKVYYIKNYFSKQGQMAIITIIRPFGYLKEWSEPSTGASPPLGLSSYSQISYQ